MAVGNALTKYELRCNGVVVDYYDTLEQVKAAMGAAVSGIGTWNFTWTKGKIVYNASANGVVGGCYDNAPDADADAKQGIAAVVGDSGSYSAAVSAMVMSDDGQTGGGN